MERLILEGVCEFVGHDGLLFVDGNPVGDVELFGLGIVETGDLVGQDVNHELVERKTLGDEAEGFEGFVVGIALFVGAVLLLLADEVVANLLLGAEAFLKRLLDGQVEQLAHLLEDFVGGLAEIGVGGDGSWCRGLGRGGGA